MSRLQVFLWRLAASAAVLIVVFAAVRLLWYPGAYFAISGVQKLLWILVGVMLVVGPVLTACVYKPGKKALLLDVTILAVVELAAVAAATALIFRNQPSFSVFAVDRFEVVSIAEIELDAGADAFLSARALTHPRLVYAQMPEDAEALDKLIEETVLMGMADIDRRPEFWRPYRTGVAAALDAAKPLNELLVRNNRENGVVSDWLTAHGGNAQRFVFLPLRGRAGDAAIILYADTGLPAATLAVDPWPPE